ncbi:MAG: extracellular solute-binding protein, partial [Ruthenibacterium sp.]
MKKALSFVLALMFALTTLAACGAPAAPASAPSASATETESAKPDTISLLLPPVSTTYQDQLATWAKEFNVLYPNLTLEFETASWEDYKQKMDVQVNAGSPPDIAFVENDNVGKYLDSGLLVDLTTLIDPATLADFDENAVQFYRNGEGLYGLPVYISIQCLGGNKAMLEEAGIDWKSIQQKGWTYEEFRDSIQKGTKDGRYGFIFACAGVTAADYLNIMVKNAGMPAPFTKEMKYAYTNQNFLKLLESLRSIIDDGSTPKEMSSVDAGMRWNMFLTGQTMVFGKGMANF